uniref:Arrestin-like N-terminal domain-containing protein n=1 Tax=Mycena chlorophos TaxID=658473 RepID=A0ABQ0LXT5_MYCCL|nr:predicted protein [Mycena chlorophos]
MDDTEAPPSYNPRISVLSEPPVYGNEDQPPPAEATAPARSNPGSLTTKPFTYEMKNFFNKTWATLTIGGDGRLSRDTPVFLEGSTIEGSVKLNLRSRDAITSVCVFFYGVLITSGDPPEESMFMNKRHFVWVARWGDPRAPRIPTPDNPVPLWTEKLRGEYDFPFSIQLPEYTTHPKDSAGVYRLPHTFIDGRSRGSIHYNLGLYIHRNSKLASDDQFSVPYGYFSMRQPPKPSLPRQLALQNNTAIPDPFEDPQGWHAFSPVLIRGRVFGERDVEFQCSAFLANPLSYTRTTSIPCFITFECDDEQALNLLASMKTSVLYLQRRVTCTFHGSSTHVQPSGKAVWWPLTGITAPRDPRRRHLMGEIALSGQLAPTSAISLFSVEYTVVLFPPDVVAFEAFASGQLATQTVEITTRFPAGPRPPQSIAPPVHTS